MEKAGKSEWYTGEDFSGDGLTLQIKSVEKVSSQYGAKADNGLVEREILEEGQIYRYTFADAEGKEKNFDSHSMPFFIAMQGVEFNLGDWLLIKRTGKLRDTRYTAELVSAPVSQGEGGIKPLNEVVLSSTTTESGDIDGIEDPF